MAIDQVDDFPVTPPSINDPVNFDVRADGTMTYFPTFIGQLNTFANQANALSDELNAIDAENGLKEIARAQASSGDAFIEAVFDKSPYSQIVIKLIGVAPSTNGRTLSLFRYNGGSNLGGFSPVASVTSSQGVTGDMYIQVVNLGQSSAVLSFRGAGSTNTGTNQEFFYAANDDVTGDYDRIRLSFSSSNILRGLMIVYGVQ